jgi:hypothetical protein
MRAYCSAEQQYQAKCSKGENCQTCPLEVRAIKLIP